jgi:hypothetical protein
VDADSLPKYFSSVGGVAAPTAGGYDTLILLAMIFFLS